MKTNLIFIIITAFTFLTSCQQASSSENSNNEKGMIKVTILYPNSEGKTFDMDYYSTKHMPMVAELLGDALVKFEIDKGMGGRTPSESIPYLAIGYLYFNQLSDYQNAFGPVAANITGDIPNYTNIQPVVQVSEVLK